MLSRCLQITLCCLLWLNNQPDAAVRDSVLCLWGTLFFFQGPSNEPGASSKVSLFVVSCVSLVCFSVCLTCLLPVAA